MLLRHGGAPLITRSWPESGVPDDLRAQGNSLRTSQTRVARKRQKTPLRRQ